MENYKNKPVTTSLETLKRRLGPPDVEQIRLQLSVLPAQRVANMLQMQTVILNTWYARLHKKHPNLSDLAICQLMFKRLQKNE